MGARVELAHLPVSDALVSCAGSRSRALYFGLAGGEDYELCLAIPPRRAAGFERACAAAGEPVACIGRFTRGRKLEFKDERGRTLTAPSGFDHFG